MKQWKVCQKMCCQISFLSSWPFSLSRRGLIGKVSKFLWVWIYPSVRNYIKWNFSILIFPKWWRKANWKQYWFQFSPANLISFQKFSWSRLNTPNMLVAKPCISHSSCILYYLLFILVQSNLFHPQFVTDAAFN